MPAHPLPARLGRLARCTGAVLAAAGVLLGAFWCYLEWGTALVEHGAQARLGHELRSRRLRTSGARRSPPAPYRWPILPDGTPVARLVIPSIGVDQVVVQGTGASDLREGPGHYPGTPYPGQAGNVAIAGHRTTYARPFFDLDHLVPGDLIELSVPGDTWDYRVVGSTVVSPDDVAVAGPLGRPGGWLTLTTCNPPYSAATRLVVRAELSDRAPPAAPPGPVPAALAAPARPGSRPQRHRWSWVSAAGPIAGWALIAAGAAAIGIPLSRRSRFAPARVAGAASSAVVILVALFELFGAVAVHLPPGY